MAKYQKFEDLPVWQEARRLTASSERPVAAIDGLPSAIPYSYSANRSRIRYPVRTDIATRNGCGKRRVRG